MFELAKQDKFNVLWNDTFNQTDLNMIVRDRFTVLEDKMCCSKCSRNDLCESAVYDNLKKLAFCFHLRLTPLVSLKERERLLCLPEKVRK